MRNFEISFWTFLGQSSNAGAPLIHEPFRSLECCGFQPPDEELVTLTQGVTVAREGHEEIRCPQCQAHCLQSLVRGSCANGVRFRVSLAHNDRATRQEGTIQTQDLNRAVRRERSLKILLGCGFFHISNVKVFHCLPQEFEDTWIYPAGSPDGTMDAECNCAVVNSLVT
jgi:hypothetical protein